MLSPDEFRAANCAAFWRGFMRGMVKGCVFCALVGLLAWPWLVKVG